MTQQAFRVRRRLALKTDAEPGAAAVILQELPGVVAAVPSRGGVQVIYDSSRVGYKQLQAVLAAQGHPSAEGRWARLKARWYAYLDDNARHNAGASGACCSNPKEIYASRRSR